MDVQDLSSDDARLIVLEMCLAAVIAQMPPASLEEVANMLCFVADTTEDVEEITTAVDGRQLGHVRHWANAMLYRVMVSRRAERSDTIGPRLTSRA
jgi:hypothetical protein